MPNGGESRWPNCQRRLWTKGLDCLPLVAFAGIGFAVAFGVLLDTLVVRSVLVTALNLDLGRRMWWPSRLGRSADDAHRDAPESPVSSSEPELTH
jgi:RND superfamily putative drug exporter